MASSHHVLVSSRPRLLRNIFSSPSRKPARRPETSDRNSGEDRGGLHDGSSVHQQDEVRGQEPHEPLHESRVSADGKQQETGGGGDATLLLQAARPTGWFSTTSTIIIAVVRDSRSSFLVAFQLFFYYNFMWSFSSCERVLIRLKIIFNHYVWKFYESFSCSTSWYFSSTVILLRSLRR